MKVLSNVLAVMFLIVFLACIGYGLYQGYEFLKSRSLAASEPWAVILVTASFIVLLSALMVASAVRGHSTQEKLRSEKADTYLLFIHSWQLNHLPGPEAEKVLRKLNFRMMLYASPGIIREYTQLLQLLQTLPAGDGKVLTKVERIILEMRKELGWKNDFLKKGELLALYRENTGIHESPPELML